MLPIRSKASQKSALVIIAVSLAATGCGSNSSGESVATVQVSPKQSVTSEVPIEQPVQSQTKPTPPTTVREQPPVATTRRPGDGPLSPIQLLPNRTITLEPRDTDVLVTFTRTESSNDFDFSLQRDGTVVMLASKRPDGDAKTYRSWKLTEAGRDRILKMIDENRLAGRRVKYGSVDGRYSMDIFGRTELEGSLALGQPADADQAALDDLISRLIDPDWLGNDVDLQPAEWTPERLSFFLKRSGSSPDGVAWPLSTPISELALPDPLHTRDPDAMVLCFSDQDVTAVWPIVRDADDLSAIPVDDGDSWTLTYIVNHPGFGPKLNLCPG